MARRRKGDRVWMVTRTDNHAGSSIIARDAEEAARRAMRYRWMEGATELDVRTFVGLPAERHTIRV